MRLFRGIAAVVASLLMAEVKAPTTAATPGMRHFVPMRHSSKRFVAMDKRAAVKARNKQRSK